LENRKCIQLIRKDNTSGKKKSEKPFSQVERKTGAREKMYDVEGNLFVSGVFILENVTASSLLRDTSWNFF